jgi:hypothetical protein
VELFALPEGRVHPTSSQVMQLVFNAFGLKYVAGKWLGTLSPPPPSPQSQFPPRLSTPSGKHPHPQARLAYPNPGSTNKTKRIKTLFMALQQVEHPDYLSEKLGMKLFKPRKVPRKNGRVWTYD